MGAKIGVLPGGKPGVGFRLWGREGGLAPGQAAKPKERDRAEDDSSGDTPGSAHDGGGSGSGVGGGGGGGRSHKRSRLGGGSGGGGGGGGDRDAVLLIDPKRSPAEGTPMQVNVGSHGQRHVKFH